MKNLDSLRKSIYDQFSKADYHVHVRRINADKHKRLPKTASVRIITSDVPDEREHYSLKPVKGSVMLLAAKKGDDMLGKLEQAYATGDVKTLKRLSAEVDKEVARRKVVSVETVVDKLIDSPAYYDLNYGTKNLLANVALVGDLPYGSMLMAWNGGKLKDEDFKLIEHAKPYERGDVEFLLVKTKPELSRIEIEALEAVPETQLGINIGASAASPGACLVLIIVFVLATHAGNCNTFHDKLAEVSLPATTIRKLGKITSAAELLNQRRTVFESFGM